MNTLEDGEDEQYDQILRINELNLSTLNPKEQDYLDPNKSTGTVIAVIGKRGCFARGTEVLMYDGTHKVIEEIMPGNLVMGDDYNARLVIEKCHNTSEMYEICPSDGGENYTVNKEHILVLYNKYINNIDNITVEDYLNIENKDDYQLVRRSSLFTCNNITYQYSPEELDPYLIGVKTGLYIRREHYPTLINSYLVEPSNLARNTILSKLDTIDVSRITLDIRRSSQKNRCKFIAGLADCLFEFDNDYFALPKNNFKVLTKDIIRLIRSVGLFVKDETLFYQISGPIDLIKSKKYNIKPTSSLNTTYNYVSFTIQSKGQGEYFGFTLNNKHTFMLASLDVVHNSGKSSIIASLLYAKKHLVPVALAFSGTEDSNQFFQKIIPNTFIFNEYNAEKIELFIKRQKIAMKHTPNPWAFLIVDDCADDPTLLNTPLQNGLLKRGRHWKICYILALQYSMDIRRSIRSNIDGTFILREPIITNRKSLWENFASIIPDFSTFCQIMDQLTNDYTALYIQNTSNNNNWKECVFWYKAPLIEGEFKFGADEYWDFHNQRYDNSYIDSFDKI